MGVPEIETNCYHIRCSLSGRSDSHLQAFLPTELLHGKQPGGVLFLWQESLVIQGTKVQNVV